jgi:FkbM family methyltransferase
MRWAAIAKSIARKSLRRCNISVIRADYLDALLYKSTLPPEALTIAQAIGFMLSPTQREILTHSCSQLMQDVFVLSTLNFKRNGFFVEFGATDGMAISNTYMLEKHYGWRGILAEPGKSWHTALKGNRGCFIESACVWKVSGAALNFRETFAAEFSTVAEFASSDYHAKLRENGKAYNVTTISLNDLLAKYNAPETIDYLSIDTEGTEYEILSGFDFSRHQFRVITCEHNFTPMRQKIFGLLTRHGYRRCFEDASRWDDWYVRTSR